MKKIKSQIINYKDPVTNKFVPFSAIGNPFKKLIDFLNDIIDVERKSIFIKDENKNMTNINSQVISMRSDVNNTEVVIDAGDVFLSIEEGHISLRELNTRTNELKKSVSDGKEMLAESITNKGIDTASTDSFSVMAENISNIVTSTKNTIAITDKPTISIGNSETIVSFKKWNKKLAIRCNKSGYFDTGIKLKSTIKIVFSGKIDYSSGSTFIGNTIGGDSKSLRLFAYNNNFYLDYGDGSSHRMYGGNINYKDIYTLEIGNRYLKDIDDNTYILQGSSYSFDYSDSEENILIFYENEIGTIAWLKIYDNDVLVRSYVPAIYNDEVCLYDEVTDTYAINQGSGTFDVDYIYQ